MNDASLILSTCQKYIFGRVTVCRCNDATPFLQNSLARVGYLVTAGEAHHIYTVYYKGGGGVLARIARFNSNK
jgi:hypothetical protein